MIEFVTEDIRKITIIAQQTFILGFFSFLIYKILKSEKSRKTYRLVLFYILNIAFTSVNLVYAFIKLNSLTFWLHFTSVYLMLLSPVFYYVFNMMILKSEELLDTRLEIIIVVIYSSTLFITMFISGFLFQGITIDQSTAWRPVWTMNFVIPMYILITIICLIPSLMRSMQILRLIKNEELRKRWKILSLGFFMLIGIGYGVFIYNSWNNTTFKIIWLLFSLIMSPTAALLIHYGFRSLH